MAFTREADITKDEIRDFEINFFVPGPNNIEEVQSGKIEVQIGLSNGDVLVKEFDLLDRLQDDPTGQAHLVNLVSLRDYIRTRLEAELLPL